MCCLLRLLLLLPSHCVFSTRAAVHAATTVPRSTPLLCASASAAVSRHSVSIGDRHTNTSYDVSALLYRSSDSSPLLLKRQHSSSELDDNSVASSSLPDSLRLTADHLPFVYDLSPTLLLCSVCAEKRERVKSRVDIASPAHQRSDENQQSYPFLSRRHSPLTLVRLSSSSPPFSLQPLSHSHSTDTRRASSHRLPHTAPPLVYESTR